MFFTAGGGLRATPPAQFRAWGSHGPKEPALEAGWTEVREPVRLFPESAVTAEERHRGFLITAPDPMTVIGPEAVPLAMRAGNSDKPVCRPRRVRNGVVRPSRDCPPGRRADRRRRPSLRPGSGHPGGLGGRAVRAERPRAGGSQGQDLSAGAVLAGEAEDRLGCQRQPPCGSG